MAQEQQNTSEEEKSSKQENKTIFDFLKSEDGKFTTDLLIKFAQLFAPSAWIAFWDFLLICAFLTVTMVCSAYKWIDPRTTETLLILIIGTIIGAKYKSK